VKDYHTNAGYKSLHFIRKGGEDLSLAINPQTAQGIDDYLVGAGHGDDPDGPLFRPLRKNQCQADPRRHLHPVGIDRILRKYEHNKRDRCNFHWRFACPFLGRPASR